MPMSFRGGMGGLGGFRAAESNNSDLQSGKNKRSRAWRRGGCYRGKKGVKIRGRLREHSDSRHTRRRVR